MADLGMWRKYEIGTMNKAVLESILALVKEYLMIYGQVPTAEEILKQMRGSA